MARKRVSGFSTPPKIREQSREHTKSARSMGKRKFTNETKVVAKSMVDAGVPRRKIVQTLGISLGHIGNIIKEFDSNQELIEWYQKNRLAVLHKAQIDNLAIQDAIRGSLTKEEIDKWTPGQKAQWFTAAGTDFGIKYDKERLEKGESTENVAVVVGAIKEWKRQKANMASLKSVHN